MKEAMGGILFKTCIARDFISLFFSSVREEERENFNF
jgi:hypothetical protein